MNRTYFWILTSLSSLITLLLLLQILLVCMAKNDEVRLAQRQQFVNLGQQSEVHLRQLAGRIYQVSQQTQDPALKELLTRQQISITPNSDSTTGSEPATSPSH